MTKDDRDRLIRMEAKLDMLIGLEPRVRRLETWRSAMASGIAVIVFGIGLVFRAH